MKALTPIFLATAAKFRQLSTVEQDVFLHKIRESLIEQDLVDDDELNKLEGHFASAFSEVKRRMKGGLSRQRALQSVAVDYLKGVKNGT